MREAYKILDTQGFIHRTKHGTYVKGIDDIARQGNFLASLELADKREMVEFVCALEPGAVFLAAKKIDEEGLKELEKLMIACEKAVDDSKELLKKNYQFHAYIRELADNNLITSALTAYYDIFNQQIIENIYAWYNNIDEFKMKSLEQHRELFDALKNNDAEKAKKIAHIHLFDDIEVHELKHKDN